MEVRIVNDLSMLVELNRFHEPKVFLHGFPDTKEVWLPVLDRLSGKSFIAPDLPSFGSSKIVDDTHMEMGLIADKIIAALSTLGIGSFSLVGHDWGGFIAWEIYAKIPQRVSSITLTNGTHPKVYSDLLKTSSIQRQISKYASFFTTAGAAERLIADQAKILKLYHPFFADEGPGSPNFFEEKWRDVMRLSAALGIYRANLDNIIHGRVSSVKAAVPVRVYWGINDHALVVENATRLDDYGLAGCSCELVEGGHWAFLERLDAFCSFLEGHHVGG